MVRETVSKTADNASRVLIDPVRVVRRLFQKFDKQPFRLRSRDVQVACMIVGL